jgi:hypothetical protein
MAQRLFCGTRKGIVLMLYEFAVEPTLLGDFQEFRYLHEKFGVPQARMISEYPKKWRRMVYEAAGSFTEMQRKILEEWMADKDTFLLSSGREYSLPDNWLKSAEASHTKKPFHAILAHENPRKHPRVIAAEQLITEKHPLFHCPRECAMPKNVGGYVAASHPLLHCSRQIIFVDPYFKAEKKWGEPLKAMFVCIPSNVTLLRYCASASPSGEDQSFRRSELVQNLPRFIPMGLSLEVVLLSKSPGRDLHNRFILTERGGLKLPWGLDTQADSPEDIVNLMEKETHQAKFLEYLNLTDHSVSDTFTITGIARR